ncbi:MAG: hypothetical protein J1F63_09315 [Oscillospiraceae bacterium]|nr:hypothetical protein [Oscillospiraceae bacterium]
MAIFKCTLRSMFLDNDTGLNIILPDKRLRPPKVLYLLHGYKQYHGSWLDQSSVARYAEGKNLAIIMPDGGRSFYTDMALTKENYYSYITKELPRFLKAQLALDPTREDTAIAGLSMGGYGALKIGMRNPARFSLIGAFSPACDIVKIADDNPELARSILGDEKAEGSENDLYRLAQELALSENDKPKIYHYCGSEDFMISENRDYRDYLEYLHLDYEYHEEPGEHVWPLWDKWAEDFINKFTK